MKEVELKPAYCWICLECNTKNFIEGEIIDIEEANEDEQDIIIGLPDYVVCPECFEKYETIINIEDDDDDETSS